MSDSASFMATDGPSKGLAQIALLSSDARLQGRPRLCSDCGLCDSYLQPAMAQLRVCAQSNRGAGATAARAQSPR